MYLANYRAGNMKCDQFAWREKKNELQKENL